MFFPTDGAAVVAAVKWGPTCSACHECCFQCHGCVDAVGRIHLYECPWWQLLAKDRFIWLCCLSSNSWPRFWVLMFPSPSVQFDYSVPACQGDGVCSPADKKKERERDEGRERFRASERDNVRGKPARSETKRKWKEKREKSKERPGGGGFSERVLSLFFSFLGGEYPT